jgi:hypothetical protein
LLFINNGTLDKALHDNKVLLMRATKHGQIRWTLRGHFFLSKGWLGPRAKLFRVRLCEWSTQVLSVVYNFRLQRLSKEQHSISLSPLRCPWLVFPTLCQLTPSSSKVADFRRQISRQPTIHGLHGQDNHPYKFNIQKEFRFRFSELFS